MRGSALILLALLTALAPDQIRLRVVTAGGGGGGGGDYDPPIGIPAPDFGIDEDIPSTATKCPSWPATASSGCYYIDNSHPSATDTANAQGYPNLPRLTIPNAHSAGDYVEIRGDGATGTYKYTTNLRPTGVGTAENPIWFVGVNTPILSAYLDIGNTNTADLGYMIFDGIQWSDGGGADIRPRFDNNAIHHIAIRNSTFKGRQLTTDGTGVSIGATVTTGNRTVQDVVLYNVSVYDYGDRNAPGEEVGVYPVMQVTRLWLLDSDIYNNAEDGVGGSHAGEHSTSFFYIGRNNIYNNLTNAIDLKGIRDVVISENIIYDHFDVWVGGIQKSSGQGEAIGAHYAGSSSGASSWNNHPTEVSIIFNTISASRYCVATSTMAKLRVVGNVCYAIHSEPTDFTTKVECFLIIGNTGDQWYVNNTCYDSDGGFRITDNPAAYNAGTTYYRHYVVSYTSKSFVCYHADCDVGIVGIDPSNAAYWREYKLHIIGNIVAGRVEASQSEYDFDGSSFYANSVTKDYNIAYGPSGVEVFFYGSTTARDLAWVQANTTHCDFCLDTDPLFTNAATRDFTLQAGSPAIGASIEGTPSVYDDFFDTYGISIQYDRAGNARPLCGSWDIGAYERTSC